MKTQPCPWLRRHDASKAIDYRSSSPIGTTIFWGSLVLASCGLLSGCEYNTYQQVDSKWGIRTFYPTEACNDLHLIRRTSEEYWAIRRYCDKYERGAR